MNGTLLDVTIFKTYNELFAGCSDIQTPKELDNTYCVYHQYTVKIPNRDNIHKMLQDSGIGAMLYYPVPLHLQKVHAHLGWKKVICRLLKKIQKWLSLFQCSLN